MEKERGYEEANEALDPELLYAKEYCIGTFDAFRLPGTCTGG